MQSPFLLKSPLCDQQPNPTLKQVIDVLAQLVDAAPKANYLILETDAIEKGDGLNFMQTRIHNRSDYECVFLVEYRDGVEKRHYRVLVQSSQLLVALFRSYLNRDGAYLNFVLWRDMSTLLSDLQPRMNSNDLASSFWEKGEYERFLQKKKRDNEQLWRDWDEAVRQM